MTQVDLDDIMSSIRTGVEAESGKPPAGSADLVDQAAAEAAAAEAATPDDAENDDDVLELTAADMAPAPEPQSAPVASASTNDAVADILGIPSLAPGENADDEFDKLLAEISAEKQTRAAEVEAVKEALLADIEPLGEVPVAYEPVAETPAMDMPAAPETVQEPTTETQPEAMPEMAQSIAADIAAPIADVTMPATPATTHEMGMIAGADGGMQLTLPAEVLAMALRPMVQNWLNANLSGVVERLVREEIAKLNG